MRALLDVNTLIALLHFEHNFHKAAHQWWSENSQYGWASCPLTENGVIRIMSNPRYSSLVKFSISDVTSLIKGFVDNSDHVFWPDDITVIDENIFDHEMILGSNQLTEVYLLGLAVKHGGVLVSFDQSILTTAIRSDPSEHLRIL